MKRFAQRMIGLLLVLSMLVGQFLLPVLPLNQVQAASDEAQTVSTDLSMQDGVTLHCWNWSFANIEANMAMIASLGYTAIQTSPIQQAKQTTAGSSATDWWVFYQPASFAIDDTGNSALGTKDDFISMCETAHEYGIKVIVDVVANHMGNTNSGYGISSAVIADIRNDSSCWHDVNTNITNYYDRYNITQYCMDGLPDLNTSSEKVQTYVLNFLKECVDAGADGFRFDAAKHIETPDDTYCASDFWPNVINGIKAYDPDVYCYGELLYNADENNSLPMSAYTEYFSVTDNSWSNAVRNDVVNSSNASAFSYSYHKDATADQLVLWAESHDNYAGDGTSSVSVTNINKTWALVAARADAMALYLARPENLSSQKLGTASITGWSYSEVAAVNKFHTAFAGQTEYVANENNIAYVERGTSGVVLVNCSGTSTSVNVTANTMADGTYTDQITGNTFTVSGGRISGSIGSTGIAVVYNAVTCDHESHNTSGICTACGAEVGHSLVDDVCTVCGYVKPANKTIYFSNTESWSTVYIYTWDDDANEYTGTWPGTAMTKVDGTIYSCSVSGEAEYVIFNNNASQTDDLTIPTDGNLYTYSTGQWSAYDICDHSYTTTVTAATCTAAGRTVYTCSLCGDSYAETIAALGHSYDAGTVTTAATCTASGVRTYTCVTCGGTKTETIAALGHSYVDGACSVCGASTPTDRTVYFDNTAGWSSVYIYYWSDDVIDMTTWPGDAMTKIDGTIYGHTIPLDAEYVIFSNGSDQTDDLTLSSSYNLYTYSSSAWSSYEACTHPSHSTDGVCTTCGLTVSHSYVSGVCSVCGYSKPAGITLYYDNSSTNWSTVYIYTWDADNNNYSGAWPGSVMTNEGDGIWSYTVEAGATYVIFNNNSSQTADLTVPGSGYLYNGSSWELYEVCEHSYTSSVTTAPTCVATGVRTYTCSLCGDSYTEVIAVVDHSYVDGVCSVCGDEQPCEHSWDEGTVTTAPTCALSGVKTYTCGLCGETKTETVAATGHSFVDGYCTVCGVPENCTDHVWDEGEVIQAATCWVAGSATYTCTVCGETKTETLPAGHKFYVSEVKEPTCTATGKQYIKCYNCKYSADKTLAKIDHSYVAEETVAPTCTTDGYTVYTCSSCGGTANLDAVDRTGHSWSGNTCANCGEVCDHNYVDGICTGCADGGPAYVNGCYEIANAAQLYWFAAQVNSGNNAINGKLTADIDLAGGTWTSIGYYCADGDATQSLAYTGTFDGQGHTVSNFTTAGTDNEGLFGYCSSATIMNVGVVNAKVTGWRAGAVAGYALTSTVTNCFAKDCTITGSTDNAIALQSGAVYIAPVSGSQGGVCSNCYAVDCTLVDATDLTVNTHPVGGVDCQNGYYYNVTAPAAFTSTRNATEVTAAQLSSGEVTWLLNKGVTDGTQAWYQTCGTGLPAHSGLTVYAVTGCGTDTTAYSNDPAASGGHNYSSVETAPTCTAAGSVTYTCQDCGDSYTEALPATDHSYVGGFCTACGKMEYAVKFQAKNDGSAIRLLSYVGDLSEYSSVTFTVTIGGKSTNLTCTNAYKSLLAGSSQVSPSDVFGEGAEYFVMYTLTGITEAYHDLDMTVTVTWTAIDGTVTTSEARTVTIGDLVG